MTGLACEAGAIALKYFADGDKTTAGVKWKSDGSPVTEADHAVNDFLERHLKAIWPTAAWLSEESADDPARLDADLVIIVDPIDGTRGFARGDRHWCIAIALVQAGRPVLAVVHAPALGDTYAAASGCGAWLNGVALKVGEAMPSPMIVSCTANLAKSMRAIGLDYDYRPKIASLALRIAMVASGAYGAGVTGRDSHDWDIAAADLVLEEAGGRLADLDGEPIRYNREQPVHGALLATPAALQPSLRAALARVGFG